MTSCADGPLRLDVPCLSGKRLAARSTVGERRQHVCVRSVEEHCHDDVGSLSVELRGAVVPFRSRAVLESWLAEYAATAPGSHLARVAEQEEESGRDSGLVVVPLNNATTSVYMQPAALGAPEWRLTFEARAEPMVVSSTDVRELAAELDAAADLLDFLEEKSRLHFASLKAE